MKFIRYGSLASQKHEIDEDNRTFHTPPVETGIYAFPKGYVEPFLLGGIGSGSLQNGRYRYLKDDNKNIIEGCYDDFYETVKEESEFTKCVFYDIDTWKSVWKEHFRKKKIDEDKARLWAVKSSDAEQSDMVIGNKELTYRIVIENKPKIFEYSGLIWHHLYSYCVHMGEDFKPESYKDKTIIKDADIIRRSGSWVLTEIQVYKKALETYMRWWKYDLSKGNKFSNRGNYPICYLSKDPLEVYIESIQKEKCQRRRK
jgi:hypothetical protein